MRKPPQPVNEIKVKGHVLQVYLEPESFTCELPDGDIVTSPSMQELEASAAEKLTQTDIMLEALQNALEFLESLGCEEADIHNNLRLAIRLLQNKYPRATQEEL